MRSWFVSASTALSCAAFATAAWAAPAGPVPLINGTERAQHVFSISGLVSDASVGTAIFCTSLEKTKDMRIAVEIFDGFSGVAVNNITAGAGVPGVLSPGETVTIEVSSNGLIASTNADSNIAATFPSGSARVVATSPKLMCAAILIDKVNALPIFAGALPVVAKTKQKGE